MLRGRVSLEVMACCGVPTALLVLPARMAKVLLVTVELRRMDWVANSQEWLCACKAAVWEVAGSWLGLLERMNSPRRSGSLKNSLEKAP